MKVFIKTLILFSTIVLILALTIMFSTFSPPIKGTIMDTSTDQPLQNINVCWERSTDSTSGEMILDQGCIRTDAGGYYKVPGIYKLFQGSVANFRIYYNMKILPPTKKPEVQSYISTKNYIEPFNLAGTNENPISEIEGYSTEKFTVYFSKSIPMYIPQKVNIGLYQKE